jgi:hypothetical protein
MTMKKYRWQNHHPEKIVVAQNQSTSEIILHNPAPLAVYTAMQIRRVIPGEQIG